MIIILLLTQFILPASAQNFMGQDQRLSVFIDCNTHCDMDFIRTEINIVDFLLDRQAADVHVLITRQETGGGGNQYQFIFFGQNQLKQMADTIRFNTAANATPFEERELFIKYLKLGLTPFIARTASAKDIEINMKKKPNENKGEGKALSSTVKDPWNYWVFRIGMNGNFDADEVYKNSRLSGNLSANRVTEESKIGFELNAGKNRDSYTIDDSNGVSKKIVNNNDDYELQQFGIKSISTHWSFGYQVVFSRNTFSNNKHRALFNTGIEYNIFPYKEVNTKFFTLAYTVNVRRNAYFDTTLYDKTAETLFGQELEAKLRIKQKWGSISPGDRLPKLFT